MGKGIKERISILEEGMELIGHNVDHLIDGQPLKSISHPLLSKESLETMEIELPDDPWRHRSEGMRCRTCMWYVDKEQAQTDQGRCRRHAPAMGGYPVVVANDWCGDHRLA